MEGIPLLGTILSVGLFVMLKIWKLTRSSALFISIAISSTLMGETEKADDAFPVHVSTALTNSVGIGTFVSGFQRMPSWGTSLSLSPSYSPPKLAGTIASSLSLGFSLSLEWFKSFAQGASNAQLRIQYSDISATYSIPKLLHWKDAGLYLSPSVGITGPISIFSRGAKRLLGYRGGMSAGWSKGEIAISYAAAYSGWAFSSANVSIPCGKNIVVVNPSDFSASLEDAAMGLDVFRKEEHIGGGQCIVSGRQKVGSLTNSLTFAWSPGDHNVTIQMGWNIGFLRPLSDNPQWKSQFASSQSFTETSSGLISYTYNIPIDLAMSFTVGISSFQSALTKDGRIRFPFVDFMSAGNNHTQIFLEWAMSV